jgi:hypothetical protein
VAGSPGRLRGIWVLPVRPISAGFRLFSPVFSEYHRAVTGVSPPPKGLSVTDGPADTTASPACPKCGKKRAHGAEACPRCGLVFALWKAGDGTTVACLDQAGQEMWRKTQENWGDSQLHEEFLKHCLQTNSLAAAGRLYRDRLDENPRDVLAAQMQNQVLSKAALGLSLNKSQPRTALTRTRWFWVIVMTAMALGIAGGLFWRRLH